MNQFGEKNKELLEIAKLFMQSGRKPNAIIINKLLNINISGYYLDNIINNSIHIKFKNLSLRKKLIKKLLKECKKHNKHSAVYI
jgi:hypothetical protein